jgi:uracil-DNA glycosylase
MAAKLNELVRGELSPSVLKGMMMSEFEDQEKLFKDERAVKARQKELQAPHIKQLSDFVTAMRSECASRKIPDFDPWDGGINAECLFLLEAPGRNALKFVSRNNNDETAKNFFSLNRAAGLPRERTISWNIVPWYIGNKDKKKIRAAKIQDIEEGIPYLRCLLELLPKLRAVVFVGKKAQQADTVVRELRPKIEIFFSPHPSPLFVNHHPDNGNQILKVLKEVSDFIGTNRNYR